MKYRHCMHALYLAQGLCFATWASRIPDIRSFFSIDYALYWGIMLFLIPVGKFLALPLAGALIARYGSKRIAQISVLGYAAALTFIGVASNVYMLGASLFVFGVFWNLCDISLNTQAVAKQRIDGRTVIAALHSCWSLAACFGALIGYFMILCGVSTWLHFLMTAALVVLLVIYANPSLLANADLMMEEAHDKKTRISYLRKPEPVLIWLGLIGLFALVVESAMFDWSGIYFESVIDAPASLQMGFLVFMMMMTLGRFITNASYSVLGKKRMLQLAGLLVFLGFIFSGLLVNLSSSFSVKIIASVVGFMLVGLGVSCMVPTIYSLVGSQSKTPASIAITMLSSISFVGSLVAPLLIGAISDGLDLSYAYMVIGIFGLLIIALTTKIKNDI